MFVSFSTGSILLLVLVFLTIGCCMKKNRRRRGRAQIYKGKRGDLKRTISEPVCVRIIPPEGLYETVNPILQTAEEREIETLPPPPAIPQVEELELAEVDFPPPPPHQIISVEL